MSHINGDLIKAIVHYQECLEKYAKREDESKMLYCIGKLWKLPVTIDHLTETGVGRTVNSLRKTGGEVGDHAKSLVAKWKEMVAKEEEESQNEEEMVEEEEEIQTELIIDYEENQEDDRDNDTHSSEEAKVERISNDKGLKHDSKQNKLNESSREKDRSTHTKKSRDKERDKGDTSRHRSKDDLVVENPRESKHKDKPKHESDNNKVSKSVHRDSNNDEQKKHSKSSKSGDKSDSEDQKSKNTKRKHTDDSKHTSSKRRNMESDSNHKQQSKTKEKSYYKSSTSKDNDRNMSDSSEGSKDRKEKSSKRESSKSHSSKEDKKRLEDRKENDKHESKPGGSSKSKDKSKHSSKVNTKESSASKHNSSSSNHTDKNQTSKTRLLTKKSKILPEAIKDGIGSGSGTSFAEALGMLEPIHSSNKGNKKRATHLSRNEKDSSGNSSPEPTSPGVNLLTNNKLEPLNLNITSLLPEITPNYKPLGYTALDSIIRNKISTDDEMLNAAMSNKIARTKVYSGNKVAWGVVPTLFDLCSRILQDNLDALEFTGGVPYSILKPILERANYNQLFMLEQYNPYLMEDTDDLWKLHCHRDFRNKHREEMETWRDMYQRCLEEREIKLRALTANIKQSQDKSIPVRQTKLAYVDSVVKPPRNIARKQVKHGTASGSLPSKKSTPSSKLVSLATSGAAGEVVVPNPVSRASSSTSVTIKPKKAPLMQKTLALMKNRFRR